MGTIVSIVFMIIIGAFIGGLTNSLAIKMLFRPHQPLFIRGKRLPFTPGLIPKRRDELALQLGRMVVDHLLTPESMEKKIIDKNFQEGFIKYVKEQLEKISQTSITIKDIFKLINVDDFSGVSNSYIDKIIQKKYNQFSKENQFKQLKSFLNDETKNKITIAVDDVTNKLLENSASYFASSEGKAIIDNLIDDFFNNRTGKMSSMIKMFLGNIDLAEKLQPEIVKIITSDTTKNVVQSLITTEIDKFLNEKYLTIEEKIGKEKIIILLQKNIKKAIDSEQIVNKQISQIIKQYEDKITNDILPQLITKFSYSVSNNVKFIMDKLAIDQIVREQVESFPIERLEEMVLSISRRELKMITYLGALLGGIIGFVQGIIVLII